MRLRDQPPEELPRAGVAGDQIYAHKPPYDTLDFIRSGGHEPPSGEDVADFEEPPALQGLVGEPDASGSSRPCPLQWSSTTTRSQTTGTSPRPGSRRRVSTHGGTTRSPARTPPTGSTSISATSPQELAANELFEKVRTADDAWPLLREFASHAQDLRGDALELPELRERAPDRDGLLGACSKKDAARWSTRRVGLDRRQSER